MTSATLTLHEELGYVQRAHGRRAFLLAVVRAAWVTPLVVLTLIYADVVFPMAASARLGADILLVAIACGAAWTAFRVVTRARSRARMVARLVEQGNPEFRNDLVNAIDFEEELQQERKRHVSTDLMNAEISQASETVSRLANYAALRPRSLKRELMYTAIAVAFAALLPMAFPHVFGAVIPRFLDPYGDHPPYSPTQFSVMPGKVTVDYGEDVRVDVETSGRPVESVTLVTETLDGNASSELTMFRDDEHAFFQTIEAPRDDLRYYAKIQDGRSKRYPLTINQMPRIEYASVTLDYPEYTGLETKTRLVGETPVRAYEGTTVTLTVQSNRPLKSGALTFGGNTIDLKPSTEPNTVRGTFQLNAAGPLTASIVDVDGRNGTDALAATLEIVPDEKPNVTITSPGRHSFATPTAHIPVMVEASDDLGVARIELFRNHNASDDDHEPIFTADSVMTFAGGYSMLDLETLGVKAGDTLEYYATATDTRPGPQTAATEAFQLRIISQDEYKEFMQTQMTAEDLSNKYGQMQEQIEQIADEQQALREATDALLEKMANGEALTEAEETQLAEMLGRQRELAEAADALAKQLREEAEKPSVFDIEDEYKEALKNIAGQLAKAGEHMQQSAEQMSEANKQPSSGQASMQASAEAQKEALEELGRQLEQFQEQIQQANKELEDVYKLMEDVEMFKHLYQLQQRIERQARTYSDTASPSLDEQVRLKELSEQQTAVEDALTELRERLREHAAEIEENYEVVAQDAYRIADEIESRKIPGIMNDAASALGQPNAPRGYPLTVTAREEMEAMIEFAQAAAGKGGSQCELRLKIQMGMNPGNTMGQFGSSLSASAANGFGGFGMGTAGEGGMASGSSPFNVYGSESGQNPLADRESPGGKRTMADTRPGPGEPDPLAGDIEELPMPEQSDVAMEAGRGEHVMEEYRTLIDAYFKSFADER